MIARPEDAERAMVRRARLRMGLFVGLAVGALLAVVGVIAYAGLVRSQEGEISQELSWGAQHGVTAGPVGCNWIFRLTAGRLDTGGVAPPAGFPMRAAMDRVAEGAPAETTVLKADGTTFHVLTEARGGGVVQVVFDARYQVADREHLLMAFVLAAAVGLLAALITGVIVGHRAVAPLAEALARQRRFVADASHELRTPIAQVHTRAQLLARRARATAAAAGAAGAAGVAGPDQSDLDRLVGATRRLGEIVDELLLSARLAANATDQPPREPVDLVALAAAAVTTETDRAAERDVRLELVAPAEPVAVPGIESALRRVVAELLTNALAHTPTGGRITVTLTGWRDRAELVVADTGDGFDPADADRLFDRFHRGAEAGDRRFGLGLALLREVVTGHGGTITAEGRPGRGATFTVRLPAARPAPSAPRRLLAGRSLLRRVPHLR
jgi:two-component system OmpR family sensor kinase